MNIFKSIKTKLILQISVLIIMSTMFVLIFVNLVNQQRPNRDSIPVTVDITRPFSEQREQIQAQIQANMQQERAENAARLLLTSFIGIFFQVIFTSAGAYLLIKKELKPLEDLNKSIADINEKMLYLQINSDSDTSDEINNLIANFNKMMSRLDKAFRSQKQFVENVSHEIKTPLTVIRSNLESIILDKKISKSDLNTSIKSSIESINFLNKLVEDLMLLSFLDKGQIQLENINISELLLEIVSELKVSAKENKLKIELNATEETKVKVNKILLRRAISNLIENAIKYSQKNSTIKVDLKNENKNIHLSIENEGDVIPEEFKDKIFERFFRIDKSRSRSTGGFGLGLAITKEIVEAFDGKIELIAKENINKFIITISRNS